jgi:hypothetical protein
MKHHAGRWFVFFCMFMIGLVVLATGPIGLALAIMIGFPILLLIAGESMAHSGPRDRR